VLTAVTEKGEVEENAGTFDCSTGECGKRDGKHNGRNECKLIANLGGKCLFHVRKTIVFLNIMKNGRNKLTIKSSFAASVFFLARFPDKIADKVLNDLSL